LYNLLASLRRCCRTLFPLLENDVIASDGQAIGRVGR